MAPRPEQLLRTQLDQIRARLDSAGLSDAKYMTNVTLSSSVLRALQIGPWKLSPIALMDTFGEESITVRRFVQALGWFSTAKMTPSWDEALALLESAKLQTGATSWTSSVVYTAAQPDSSVPLSESEPFETGEEAQITLSSTRRKRELGEVEMSLPRARRQRRACQNCRKRKKKCDRDRDAPCKPCAASGLTNECQRDDFTTERDKRENGPPGAGLDIEADSELDETHSIEGARGVSNTQSQYEGRADEDMDDTNLAVEYMSSPVSSTLSVVHCVSTQSLHQTSDTVERDDIHGEFSAGVDEGVGAAFNSSPPAFDSTAPNSPRSSHTPQSRHSSALLGYELLQDFGARPDSSAHKTSLSNPNPLAKVQTEFNRTSQAAPFSCDANTEPEAEPEPEPAFEPAPEAEPEAEPDVEVAARCAIMRPYSIDGCLDSTRAADEKLLWSNVDVSRLVAALDPGRMLGHYQINTFLDRLLPAEVCIVHDAGSLPRDQVNLNLTPTLVKAKVAEWNVRPLEGPKDKAVIAPFCIQPAKGIGHWVLFRKLAREPTIELYDSLQSKTEFGSYIGCIAERIFSAVGVGVATQGVPQQLPGLDCGVYTLVFALYLAFANVPSNLDFNPTLWRRVLQGFAQQSKVKEIVEAIYNDECKPTVIEEVRNDDEELLMRLRARYKVTIRLYAQVCEISRLSNMLAESARRHCTFLQQDSEKARQFDEMAKDLAERHKKLETHGFDADWISQQSTIGKMYDADIQQHTKRMSNIKRAQTKADDVLTGTNQFQTMVLGVSEIVGSWRTELQLSINNVKVRLCATASELEQQAKHIRSIVDDA